MSEICIFTQTKNVYQQWYLCHTCQRDGPMDFYDKVCHMLQDVTYCCYIKTVCANKEDFALVNLFANSTTMEGKWALSVQTLETPWTEEPMMKTVKATNVTRDLNVITFDLQTE